MICKPTLIPKAEVARKHGLSGFTNDQISSTFRTGKAQNVQDRNIGLIHDMLIVWTQIAFKSEADRFPNYGKTVGMNPSQWWSNVGYSSVLRVSFAT